ncbi:MAG TPA: hypothetical protein VF540_13465 [Segetibacter sp.]|jgi:hypothetical protein
MKVDSETSIFNLEQENSKIPNTIYEYARFGILVQNIAWGIFGYGIYIWVLLTSDVITLKHLLIGIGLVLIGLISHRSLLRLTEKIDVTKDGISKKTPISKIHILWKDIKRVKLYNSWLEGHCYKVESVNGDSISVSEMLGGYEKLYKTLEKNVASSNLIK